MSLLEREVAASKHVESSAAAKQYVKRATEHFAGAVLTTEEVFRRCRGAAASVGVFAAKLPPEVEADLIQDLVIYALTMRASEERETPSQKAVDIRRFGFERALARLWFRASYPRSEHSIMRRIEAFLVMPRVDDCNIARLARRAKGLLVEAKNAEKGQISAPVFEEDSTFGNLAETVPVYAPEVSLIPLADTLSDYGKSEQIALHAALTGMPKEQQARHFGVSVDRIKQGRKLGRRALEERFGSPRKLADFLADLEGSTDLVAADEHAILSIISRYSQCLSNVVSFTSGHEGGPLSSHPKGKPSITPRLVHGYEVTSLVESAGSGHLHFVKEGDYLAASLDYAENHRSQVRAETGFAYRRALEAIAA